MKYMLMRMADVDTEKGVMPSEELLQRGMCHQRCMAASCIPR